tara:strand:- start:11 stop:478 length:468 start_codon:yes stop_codon:yes gene_type:complete
MENISIFKIKNNAELKKAFDVRIKVFVDEQGCPISEERDKWDNWDTINKESFHFNIYYKDVCAGTARVIIEDNSNSNFSAKIQRVCILDKFRNIHLGKYLMTELHQFIIKSGFKYSELSAQISAIGFYSKLGYKEEGKIYMDAGIEHKKMTKKLV